MSYSAQRRAGFLVGGYKSRPRKREEEPERVSKRDKLEALTFRLQTRHDYLSHDVSFRSFEEEKWFQGLNRTIYEKENQQFLGQFKLTVQQKNNFKCFLAYYTMVKSEEQGYAYHRQTFYNMRASMSLLVKLVDIHRYYCDEQGKFLINKFLHFCHFNTLLMIWLFDNDNKDFVPYIPKRYQYLVPIYNLFQQIKKQHEKHQKYLTEVFLYWPDDDFKSMIANKELVLNNDIQDLMNDVDNVKPEKWQEVFYQDVCQESYYYDTGVDELIKYFEEHQAVSQSDRRNINGYCLDGQNYSHMYSIHHTIALKLMLNDYDDYQWLNDSEIDETDKRVQMLNHIVLILIIRRNEHKANKPDWQKEKVKWISQRYRQMVYQMIYSVTRVLTRDPATIVCSYFI